MDQVKDYIRQPWRHMPVSPATQKVEVGGSQVQGQPQQFIETLSQNKNF